MTDTYAFYAYVEEWPEIIEQVSRLEPMLRASGRPAAADLLLRAYGELRDDLTRLGTNEAIAGTVALRAMEARTRVRPDTGGGGGPRLGDSLVVENIGGALLPGSIGVANLDLLDANVPWWITNEIGSSARIGGKLFGFFYGGSSGAVPNRGDFREHPLFTPASYKDGGGSGVIEEPIPARRFIEASVKVINDHWRSEFLAIRARFDARLDTVGETRR